MKCALSHATSRALQILLIGTAIFFAITAYATAQPRQASVPLPGSCVSVDRALETPRPSAVIGEGMTLTALQSVLVSINAPSPVTPERAIIFDFGPLMAVFFVRGQVACFVMLTNSRSLRSVAFPLRADLDFKISRVSIIKPG